MINVLTEKTYPIQELARKLPHKRTINTIRMWCQVGVYSCDRAATTNLKRIKLESIQVAGSTYSSVEAYSRWCQKLTDEKQRLLDEDDE